ncbi:hypothetical protein COLO4_10479 [Corchorus olitorius]|uniref:Uncharacterized protein n=1 Tax=Corchorus olitorius TaxID=93759 RepID=A0A1R3K8J1_9ROSI|nr:hypothetical protein COLO4_10479 [Corchorus olitorius]
MATRAEIWDYYQKIYKEEIQVYNNTIMDGVVMLGSDLTLVVTMHACFTMWFTPPYLCSHVLLAILTSVSFSLNLVMVLLFFLVRSHRGSSQLEICLSIYKKLSAEIGPAITIAANSQNTGQSGVLTETAPELPA